MKRKVYFARKDDFGIIAYENAKEQNVFLQIAAVEYAPQIYNVLICDKANYNIEKIITNAFEYSIIKREYIDIGWKYKHIWKPFMNVKLQGELDFTQSELFHAKRDLSILIQKLQEILLYVEPSEEGLQAYSHKMRELLFLACSDLESTFKKYNFKKNERMNDYIEILKYVDLTKYKISLVGYANPCSCSPFENWNKEKASTSLKWYDAYNKIKHDREKNFHLATLESCVSAVSANLIMFAIRYAPSFLYNENDVCSNLARSSLEYKIEKSSDFYIPIVEGKRSYSGCYDMPFTFRNGTQIHGIYDVADTLPYEEREIK